MKFRITFKDPDCMIQGAGEDADGEEIEFVDQLPPKARELVDEFLKFSEYVTIEFYTETGEAVVLPSKEHP